MNRTTHDQQALALRSALEQAGFQFIAAPQPTARNDADAKSILRAAGCTMSKHDGEYRVAPDAYTFPQLDAEQRENMAYYTDDRQDAVNTGLQMGRMFKQG